MRTTIKAQFDRPDLVLHAADRLRQDGFTAAAMTLVTASPGPSGYAAGAPFGARRAPVAARARRWLQGLRLPTDAAAPSHGANILTLQVDDDASAQRARTLLQEQGASAIDGAPVLPSVAAPARGQRMRPQHAPSLFQAAGPLSLQYSRQNEPAYFAGQSLQEALPHLAFYRPEEPAGTATEPELGWASSFEFAAPHRHCADAATAPGPEADYRRHCRENYPDVVFETIEPAYAFGAQAACGERYQGHTWSQAEPCLCTDWEAEQNFSASWERVAPAVRFGWDLFRDV